jgi:predicted dehydrogenase
MKKVSIVLVGGNGHGRRYLERCLLNPQYAEQLKLVGVVDLAELIMREEIRKAGSQIYSSLENFYKDNRADIAIVCTPPFLHESMSCYCMEHGSNVLCEKPVTPTLQQAERIQQCINRTGRMFGVGFQWSYNPVILSIKKDILSGKFGKPLSLWTFTSWPRGWAYFNRWNGKLFDTQGGFLLDSVASNATSHHLHNSLFLIGERLDNAAQVKEMKAELYRANDIESYDTCAVRYNTISGVELGYIASHATHLNRDPHMEYRFEQGILRSIIDETEGGISGFIFTFNDGRVVDYGAPSDTVCKTLALANATANSDDAFITCKLSTALPHLTLCNAMLNFCDISNFPAVLINRNDEAERNEIPVLYEQLNNAFVSQKLPSEMGYNWARPSEWYNIEEYKAFCGSRLKKTIGTS